MSNLGKGLVVAIVVMAQCCVLQPALGQDRKAAVNADVTIEDLALCNDKIEDQFRHALAEQAGEGAGSGSQRSGERNAKQPSLFFLRTPITGK